MWWLMACGWGPATQVDSVAVPGLEVALPAGGVVDAELSERTLAELTSARPDQVHGLVVARVGDVVVQLQRTEDPAPERLGNTVSDVLEAAAADVRARLEQSGTVELQLAGRDQGREVCGRLDVPGGVANTCSFVAVDHERRLVVLSVTCTAPSHSGCADIVSGRRLVPGPTLPLGTGLVDTVGLPGPGRSVWGFELGSTRAEFRDRCRAAGHTADGYDWATELPTVREWVDAGRASKCSQVPATPALGPVSSASAVFDADRLIGLTVFVAVDPNVVEGALSAQYPLSVAGTDQVLHVIDGEAVDDALTSVTLFRSGEGSALTFLSARGYEASSP